MITISHGGGRDGDGQCVAVENGEVVARFEGPKKDDYLALFAEIVRAADGLALLAQNPPWRIDDSDGLIKLAMNGRSAESSSFGHPILVIIAKLAEDIARQREVDR